MVYSSIEEWLGKDNKLGLDIWEKKYRYNQETFNMWLDRVSSGNEQLRQLILDKKFLFGGRALSNINTDNKSSYFNCYSRGFIEDDLVDIMQANTDIALTYKAQGGQGLSLSKLRPKGTPIGTRYFSDGIIPFMKMYNETTSAISQGGSRKGALMISLDCRHKEVEDFIKIKTNDDQISKANLSLEVDDEFMKAVNQFYITGEEVVIHETREFENHVIEYDIIPIKIYKLMCQTCYDWADPAILYTDRFRNYNLMECIDDYKIETSNPCVTGDTQILTSEGYKYIKDVVDQNILIWNGYKFSSTKPMITGVNQKILKIKFSNGSEIKCTPYHKFILKDNQRIAAEDLQIGDSLIKCNFPIINGTMSLKNAYTQGFFSGDGFICNDRNAKYISFYGENKRNLVGYCAVINQRENCDNRETYSVDVDFPKDFVPLDNYSVGSKCEWLAGLVDSDGSNNADKSIVITSINYNFLYSTKLMLNTLGIDCTLQQSHAECDKLMPKGNTTATYHCHELFRLTISSSDVIKLNMLGFNPHRVSNNGIPNRNAKRYISVVNIEEQQHNEAFVYCFTEESNHSGIFNGIITAQCGEQPLPKNFCCNLGSLNLAEFIDNKFMSTATFNFYNFAYAIGIAIRALDDIIDKNAEYHALKEQKINSLNYRNIGLGVFGYADMLMMLGLTYGSEKAVEFTDELFNFMFTHSVYTSNTLAIEKGAFPKYNDKLFDSEIIKKHFSEKTISQFKKTGMRNCSLLSIAPTGSISMMFERSGGCEPEFAISYKRKTESLNDGQDKYYDMYCKTASEFLDKYPNTTLPYYFVSSADIAYKDRIDIQAVMQHHVDTAISSTVNLPNSTTVKQIEYLYLHAWRKGLKGITIYRDGCNRSGILTTSDSKSNLGEAIVLKRGDVIQVTDNVVGLKRKLNTGCGSLHSTAFFDPIKGDLLETYLSKGSTGGCEKFMVGLSRMISLAARAGCNIYDIVDQLNSCGSCSSYAVRSATKHDTSKGACCPISVGNALLDMWKEMQERILTPTDTAKPTIDTTKHNNNNIDTYDTCPQCGSEVAFQGGCNLCLACGWSKCE